MNIISKKQIAIILTVALCIAIVGGCKGNDSDSDGQKVSEVKDTVVVLLSGEPTNLDPTKSNVHDIGNVTAYIMEGLWYTEQEGGYSNRLVEEWEMTDNNTTLNIKLKDNVKFSDGTPMTAEDVLWNLIRCSEAPLTKSYFKNFDVENSKVVDDHNLIVKFTQADSTFIDTCASMRCHIVSKKAFEKDGEAGVARNPISVGPYKLVDWVSGAYIKLEANEYYHGGEPKVKHITLKFIPEPSARLIELETGAGDIAYNIDPKDIERVNNIDGYHVVKGDSLRYYLITLSMKEPLFQNKDVRYALTHAIDKKGLVEACTDGIGNPISTMAPPLAAEGTKVMPEITYDVEKAKELLAKGGHPNGFEIDLHVEPNAEMQRLAEAVQSMWAEIGVKANVVSIPLATYDAQNKGNFQATIRTGSSKDITQIWSIYEIAFGSRLSPNDKVLDDKLAELKKYFPGEPRRVELVEEIADYLYDIRFSYPFMTMPTIYVVSDKVKDFEFHGTTYFLDPKGWSIAN